MFRYFVAILCDFILKDSLFRYCDYIKLIREKSCSLKLHILPKKVLLNKSFIWLFKYFLVYVSFSIPFTSDVVISHLILFLTLCSESFNIFNHVFYVRFSIIIFIFENMQVKF